MQFKHMYIKFRQNFCQKKKKSPFQKKTLADTINCIPKSLHKENLFYGPFAHLSYIIFIKIKFNNNNNINIGL